MHDGERELKKRLNVCKQYKIFTAFWDFIPKCKSWWIVDAVKDKKKRRKKKIKIKTTKAKKEKGKKNKRLSPSLDSNHDRLRGKQGSYPLDYCIIWIVRQICKIFVQISVHRMGDQELKHITISSRLNFFKSAKRSRKS